MKLSSLSILLGLLVAAPQVFGLLQPQAFASAARKFPRATTLGWGLMLVATAWFLLNVNAEAISDFAAYKNYMILFFAAIGIGTCVFVRDFLPVRALAILMMLLARTMVEAARWADTEWRLVIVVWAYALVVVGLWFTISPWRCRDLLEWATASEKRIRVGSVLRLAFGLLVLLLGLTAFRSAEAREAQDLSALPAAVRMVS